jgi:hypothetical protein
MAEEKPRKATEEPPALADKRQAAISPKPQTQALSSPAQPQAIPPAPAPQAISSSTPFQALSSPTQQQAISSATPLQALSSPTPPQAISCPPQAQAISSPSPSQAIPAGPEQQAIAASPMLQLPSPKEQLQPHKGTAPDDPHRQTIQELLKGVRTIAVVGASNTPGKPSHRVTFYLMHAGFDIYPVNPTLKELGGRPAYPDLKSIPAGTRIDVVDIFRKPEAVMPVIEEAIAIGAGAVWMQEGIVNEEAAAKARAAGLKVVMDHCIMKEHRMMRGLPAEEPKQ